MATATVGAQRARKMQEQKEPRMLKFERTNDRISGHLYSIQQVSVKDNESPTVQYDVLDDNGEHVTFLQTYDLGRKLRKEHIGHYVEITYLGEDHSVRTQGSPLRRFRVMVSETREIDPELGF